MKTEITNLSPKNEDKKLETVAEVGGEDQPKPFITKKKIIFIIIFLLISIGCVFITVFPILKIDLNAFNKSMGISFAKNIGILWLFLILVNAFINVNRGFITFIPRLRSFGYKIPYKHSLHFGIVIAFLTAVTPFNLVIDPYAVFWMTTNKVPLSRATSILFSNTLLWQIAQVLVNIPFFIICSSNLNLLLIDAQGKALYTMICVGMLLDLVGCIFCFLLNFSKNFHYFCSRVFNGIKKRLHLKYHTKEESEKKYKKRAVMKQDFIASVKDWKTTGLILFLWIAGEILHMFYIPWCMYFMQHVAVTNTDGDLCVAKAIFDFKWAFFSSRLAVIANRINLLPGQAMGLEASLVKLLDVYSNFNIEVSIGEITPEVQEGIKMTVSKNAVLASKIFVFWLPAIIGLFGFVSLTREQIKQAKQVNK